MLWVIISSFSRTAHLHIGRVIQSNSCSVKQLIVFLQSYAPHSPDLNPVDYKIWGIMQQRVYEMQIHNVGKLKRRLVDVWSGLHNVLLTLLSASGESVCRSVREGRTF